MTELTIETFEELLNNGYNKELDEMETFPPEIRKKIEEVYKNMVYEWIDFMKSQKKEE